ncbi:hypothetical protein MML48_4g00013969 [Holotrichia oblita]|uniref:Uncharacterized protein n=1 Tax=Holotrichia oblita TaxID=644536 RepID=A0ACB9TAZ7_HOLOL|nr:hypothetical protein MML48_4g00013969 [Holotrichia oblita]
MTADISPQKVKYLVMMNKSKIPPDSASSSGLQKLLCNAGPLTNDKNQKQEIKPEHGIQEDLPVASVSGLQNSTESNQQIKFVEIGSLPKIIRPILKANNRKQIASILSSTPNKENLEEKEREKNSKNDAKKRKCEERVFNKTRTKIIEEIPKRSDEEILCPGCEERYFDPAVEDWIKCDVL